MNRTRRDFMKDAAASAGALAVVGTIGGTASAGADRTHVPAPDARCPFFDQPLTCSGPDAGGRYPCDD